MPAMPVPVWVDDWQQECCGQELALGRQVSWTLVEADRVLALLGDAPPGLVAEEHHLDLPGVPVTTGRVRRLRVAVCDTERHPAGEGNVYTVVPGSARLTDVGHWTDGPRGPGRMGYLVDLEVDRAAGSS
jgi:hypothetical protein